MHRSWDWVPWGPLSLGHCCVMGIESRSGIERARRPNRWCGPAELVPVVGHEVRQLTERIQADRYDGSQAALRTYSAAAARLVQQARDGRMAADFPRYAAGAFDQGMSAGLGDEDLAALIKVLRRGA